MKKDSFKITSLASATDQEIAALASEVVLRGSGGDFAWIGAVSNAISALDGNIDVEGRYEGLTRAVYGALLANPCAESLQVLLDTLSWPQEGLPRHQTERRLASQVAHAYNFTDIERIAFSEERLSNRREREFGACLLHELVLKCYDVEQYPGMVSFARTLAAERHPLSALPLRLLAEEEEVRRPADAVDGWTWTLPPSPLVDLSGGLPSSEVPRGRLAEVLEVTETDTSESRRAMGAAVEHWCTQSNGKVSAQEFWLSTQISPEDFPFLAAEFPLTPWNAVDGDSPTWYPASAQSIFRVLLSAAVLGPAYGPGLYGAYGRLAAWRSVAGMTGMPADASIERVAEIAQSTTWHRAETSSDWFYEVAWDFAISAVRPGGHEIAVLAATDTD